MYKTVLKFIFIVVFIMLIDIGCSNNNLEDMSDESESVVIEEIDLDDLELESTEMSKIIKIGISEWEPYTGESIKDNGMLTALSNAALEYMGYETKVVLLPWARCVEMAKQGAIDAVIGASYTEEREEYFSYPDALWTSSMVFYSVMGGNNRYESIEKLAPATIGIYNGSNFIEDFENIRGIELEKVETISSNLSKLAIGRIDYVFDSKDAIKYMLATSLKDLADDIQIVEPEFIMDNLYIVFSKENPNYEKLTNYFNEGLKAIKENGTYDKIVNDFGLL